MNLRPGLGQDEPATRHDERLFLAYIHRNPVNRQILQLAPRLGVGDWWLTAGALFQTVWNVLDGRDPGAGIRDYDLFYSTAASERMRRTVTVTCSVGRWYRTLCLHPATCT